MKTLVKLLGILLIFMVLGACTPHHKELKRQTCDLELNLMKKTSDLLNTLQTKAIMDVEDKVLFDQLLVVSDSAKVKTISLDTKTDADIKFLTKTFETFELLWVENNLEYLSAKSVRTLNEFINQLNLYKTTDTNVINIQPEILKMSEFIRVEKWIEKEDAFFLDLTIVANSAWKQVLEGVQKYSENQYKLYSKTIDGLPETFFDANKIKDILEVPYNDQKTLVVLFKNYLKAKLQKHEETFNIQLKDLNFLFGKIDSINLLFLGKYNNDKAIYKIIKEIRPLLENTGKEQEEIKIEKIIKINS